MVEAYVVRASINQMNEKGYMKVLFEIDSKLIIDYLNDIVEVPRELKDILDDCKRTLKIFQQYKVVHVLREGNTEINAMENAIQRQSERRFWDYFHVSSPIKTIILK